MPLETSKSAFNSTEIIFRSLDLDLWEMFIFHPWEFERWMLL